MIDQLTIQVAELLDPILGESVSEVEFAGLVDDAVADLLARVGGAGEAPV